jgi:LacI family transcriptional regulator
LNGGRPTILDVAERAGVSVGTVSNVLNGTIRVSDRRRQCVLQAIEELSYTQNLLAQGLRRRRAPVIGLCVPNTTVAYFAKLVDAFDDVASSLGSAIMQMLSHDDPQTELERVSTLLNYRVCGIVLVPSMRPARALEAIARSGTPLVVVDRPVAGGRFDQVTFDNRSAMMQAVQGLIALGHRRIMFIVRLRALATTRQRVAALRAAACAARAEVTTTILQCNSYDPEEIVARFVEVLKGPDGPTAIIVSNSMFAACMLRAFEALGIRCPDDMSLLAFDQPEWAGLVTPKLSVVRQPTLDVARKAWEFLIRRMEDETAPVQTLELQADVLFSASVGPPRQDRAIRLTGRATAARRRIRSLVPSA